MTNLMTNLAPLVAIMFVAACVLWLVWRGMRGMFRTSGKRADGRPAPAPHDAARREPVLGSSAAAPSQPHQAIPDAADVLALKASIDALTRQIGALERRLAPANSNVPAAPTPRPSNGSGIERERDFLNLDASVVVPDRRI